jgi:hypothetical protein
MGKSKVTHTPLARFLGHADALPPDAIQALELCIRSYSIFGNNTLSSISSKSFYLNFSHVIPFFLVDATHGSFGLPTVSKYHPLVEVTYPPEVHVPCFYSWVSTYNTHSDLSRQMHDQTLLDSTPVPYRAPPCTRPATLDPIGHAALDAVSWLSPIQGSEGLLHGMPFGSVAYPLLDLCLLVSQ